MSASATVAKTYGNDAHTHHADVATDDGLRQLLNEYTGREWWESPPGRDLLGEIRHRAVRNAAHVAARADIPAGRDLVDDVVTAAWLVLHDHADKVISASRPWAYLMSSVERHVFAEVRAQQLLTSPTSIRGRAREVLPQAVRTVGATSLDLAIAFRHESTSEPDGASDSRIMCQVRRHADGPLVDQGLPSARTDEKREPWYTALIKLLVDHGANQATVVAVVDRLADLFGVTSPGWWEWEARRDPVLTRLGLTPDQASALVAIVAGGRRHRHNGKADSLLRATRTTQQTVDPAELSRLQQRRMATFTGIWTAPTGATSQPRGS